MHLYYKDERIITIYKKQENREYLFSITCKVTPVEKTHLYKSNGNFVTDSVLNNQNN